MATSVFMRVIDFFVRLSFFRYLVATISINLELYWYIHQNDRNILENFILLLYIIAFIVLIPLYIIIVINDVLISLWFVFIYQFICNINIGCNGGCCGAIHNTTVKDRNVINAGNSTSSSDDSNNNNNNNNNEMSLRIMSFNIQNGAGMDGKIDINRTTNVITNENVNIVCLQEVEKFSEKYKTDETKDISIATKLTYFEEIDVRDQYWGGIYGDSIISQYPIIEKDTIKYNLPHWKFRNPRKILALKLDISQLFSKNKDNIIEKTNSNTLSVSGATTSSAGNSSVSGDSGNIASGMSESSIDNDATCPSESLEIENTKHIWVVNTHLQNDPTFDENWYQVKHLYDLCENIVEKENNNENFYGLIVCGDFNLPYFSSPIQYLRSKMIHCVQGATFPSTKPMAQIDHIFLHKKSKLKLIHSKSKIVQNNIASDHMPVVASFVV